MKLPAPAPRFLDLLAKENTAAVFHALAGIQPAPGGKYRHWHTLRFVPPPPGLTSEQWWLGVKMARQSVLKSLPLTDRDGHPFRVGMPDPLLELVHVIDRDASGQIQVSEEVTNPRSRERYLINSLIDEAITSSQLEGAATTHVVAEQMLRTGRRPTNRDERMIANNYWAMRHVRGMIENDLTPESVLGLHRVLTLDAIDNPDAVGRLRTPDEEIRVWDSRDQTVLHTPPPADTLENRMTLMCEFANGRLPEFYVHPVVRAAILHFWLAYDHPFVDGNGRTARALFYWSMLRQNYWLSEYISISSIVKKAPGKYMRAYLYSEDDENDLTYFVLYHLRVVRRAIAHLHDDLRRKMAEYRQTQQLLGGIPSLNHRQLALLGHALRNPGFRYSVQSHRRSHGVVNQTARTDLAQLVKLRLLDKSRVGRRHVFSAPADLSERIHRKTR